MSLKITLVIISIVMSLLFVITRYTQIGINMTPSLPHTIFLTLKGSSFGKGDLVTIAGHPTRYYPHALFTKYIKGVSGDRINVQDHKIYINEEEIGCLHAKTLQEEPLTPLKSQVIPPNMLFIAASHERSFDSRYQEFGLVPTHKVVGRAIVLW